MKRRRLAERRKAVGLSQERLAEIVGVDRTTVARWEAGASEPQPWIRPRLATALQVSNDELAEFIGGGATHLREQPRYIPEVDIQFGQKAVMFGRGSGLYDLDTHGADRIEKLVAGVLQIEAELGGDQLYGSLAGYVDRFALAVNERAEPPLLRAFGQLCQMTGWLAIDSNRHQAAHRYLSTAVLAAHQAEDSALAASAMAYMSLHETYRDRSQPALALAQTAASVGNDVTPKVSAMLATRLARAYAKLGDVDAALRALGSAESECAQTAFEPEPIWISYVDTIELLAQSGACHLELGRYSNALDKLDQAVSIMDTLRPTHVRDRVHYLARIAKCHLGMGDIEHACAAGHEALDAALTVGSTRVIERLTEFNTALSTWSKLSVVRDFHDRFSLFTQTR